MELTEQIKFQLHREGYREIIYPGEYIGICAIYRYAFTWGIVHGLNEEGYNGRWCFETYQECIDSFNAWDKVKDPPGNWIKYKGKTGEYTNPNKKVIIKKKQNSN